MLEYFSCIVLLWFWYKTLAFSVGRESPYKGPTSSFGDQWSLDEDDILPVSWLMLNRLTREIYVGAWPDGVGNEVFMIDIVCEVNWASVVADSRCSVSFL